MSGNPERGSRQPELTKPVRAKFRVLTIASWKRQDRFGKKGGMGAKKKATLTMAVGVTIKSEASSTGNS